MVELVYTRDLKSLAYRLMGSNPIGATIVSPLVQRRSDVRLWSQATDGPKGGSASLVLEGAFGLLAQLVEHRTFNPQVEGSIPSQPTIFI